MKTIPQQIEGCGWSIETIQCGELVSGTITPSYRAYQGGFKTLWRPSPEQVLSDVRKIVEARKNPEHCPF